MSQPRTGSLRRRVAHEAAELLYTGQEKEYKQAKLTAARNLAAHVIPGNIEVAKELDLIADEREGVGRQERIVRLRWKALDFMDILSDFTPILVGSVWRGTARRTSDIDLSVFSSNPEEVVRVLKDSGNVPEKIEIQEVTKHGEKQFSTHIFLKSEMNVQIEIVVRDPEEASHQPKCEIYRDAVSGLTGSQLRSLLEKDPVRKFVPV